ncbi:hypothetical protein [Erythrobacter sp. F6033]|uniref:hypothetical protein n=1 Tax=Erythrobacter sp. F6033 TaxID=2926401 RepID=UPI001FF32443|nr:hypothetical protein [Erythrobacter sp. F6033]MCK0127436.1 hypothetical protein [Erythrobacter sp. F6033]
MDLNELLHAHQLAAIRAHAANSVDERQNHFETIALYARRIRLLRKEGGTPESEAPFVYGEAPHR